MIHAKGSVSANMLTLTKRKRNKIFVCVFYAYQERRRMRKKYKQEVHDQATEYLNRRVMKCIFSKKCSVKFLEVTGFQCMDIWKGIETSEFTLIDIYRKHDIRKSCYMKLEKGDKLSQYKMKHV